MDYKDYEVITTSDGSQTLFSAQYNQCYHSTKDGALNEALTKHIEPAFEYFKDQPELTILDICFGLGLNTLATLWYNDHFGYHKTLHIYSPELDDTLLSKLDTLVYPEALAPYLPLLKSLIEAKELTTAHYDLHLYIGDARDYIKEFRDFFDLVYQDAFSPDENPLLWTKEYFHDIKKSVKPQAMLTTYSIALKTRLALYENGFNLYTVKKEGVRASTVALTQSSTLFEAVDMEHKKTCNPTVQALSDRDL